MSKNFPPARQVVRNATFFIALNVLFVTAAEIALKAGANETVWNNAVLPWLGIAALHSLWVWLGIVLLVLSFFPWLQALHGMPLAKAFAYSNAVHITVPLSSAWILRENVDLARWFGIGLVMLGLWFVMRSRAGKRAL